MGRGDDNLLFHPVKIKKTEKPRAPQRGVGGLLPYQSYELIMTPNFVAFQDRDDNIQILNNDFTEKHNLAKENPNGEPNRIAATSTSFTWGNSEGFMIKEMSGKNLPAVYHEAPPGPVLDIHLDDKGDFHCLWLNEDNGRVTLSQISSSAPTDDWFHAREYEEYEESMIFAKKGRNSLMIEEGYRGIYYLHGFSASGQCLSLSTWRKYFPEGNPERLITPLDEKRDQYLALIISDQGIPQITSLEAKMPSGEENHFAEEREIVPLPEKQNTRFYDIAYSEGRGLLLSSDELILFNEKGVEERIPLQEAEHDIYDRLSFLGERAILWKEGLSTYQEFSLPRS